MLGGLRLLARRGLATAAKPAAAAAAPPASGPEVVVPLKLFGLPARYASALYVAAAKAKELPSVEKELLSVVDLAKKEPKFGLFLRDPSASTGDKLKGVSSFLESAKYSTTTKNFFGASTQRAVAASQAAGCFGAQRACRRETGPPPGLVSSPGQLTRPQRSGACGERAPGGRGAHCQQV
jgi:hypothetical protein